jgi:hypothetical protein
MLTQPQRDALEHVARAFGWDRRPLEDVAMIAWAAFHYYVVRLGRAHGD